MSLDKDVIKQIHELNAVVHEHSTQYFHTAPLAFSKTYIALPGQIKHTFEIEYGIKDLFTIGAITKSSMLLTGGTDLGKTTLAKLIMNALFGKENWHKVDIDTDFGKDIYADVDFKVIKEGKKSSEGLFTLKPFLQLPGIIWDEFNRTDARIANKLLHLFEDSITLPSGEKAILGTPMSDGENYQFRIAAINEGSDYSGTFDIDKALRRRTIIEIPMEIFPTTPYDRLNMQRQKSRELKLDNETNHLNQIFSLYQEIEKNLSSSSIAELFIAYLESFDYCKNSLTEKKGSIASRNGSIRHVCTQPIQVGDIESGTEIGCEFLKAFDNELCPHVTGITGGISERLRSVAKGFAALRATKFVEMLFGHIDGKNERPLSYKINNPEMFEESLQQYSGTQLSGRDLAIASIDKYINNLQLEKEDILAAIGFVGYSKIGIAAPWITKYYQGNRYQAVKVFTDEASRKFEDGLARQELANIEKILEGRATEQQLGKIQKYCREENPWMWKVLLPYINKGFNHQNAGNIADLYSN